MSAYADIPSKRIEPHSRVCASTVVQLLHLTLKEGQPADNALSAHLRANHQLGARDRRIISETLFSLLRWWGWLKHLAPKAFFDRPDGSPQEADSTKLAEWFPCLAASWLLEGRPELPPSAKWWLAQSGISLHDIPALPPKATIPMRRRCLRPFFEDGRMPELSLEMLLPNWCREEVDCPRDWLELVEWMQARPPVWLRAQVLDIDRLVAEFASVDVKLARHPLMKQALKASFIGVNLRQMPSFEAGRFEIQDAASQAVAIICAPKPGENWWDCCAGAGGKTLHLATLMQGKGKIQATDNRIYKLDDLKKRAARCGRSNIICKEWLGIEVPRLREHFSGVLVDVPCTCSGTWRRNPGARWTCRREEIGELAALQLQLLSNASSAVAHGGTLVYSTCSMFTRENIKVVEAFLAGHPEFALQPFTSPVTGEETPGFCQSWPWDADCDAMFTAKFQRS